MAEYDIGDSIKLYTTTPFTDKSTDTATDPDVVRFRVRKPDGTVTSYVYGTDAEVVRDGTGDYHMLVRPAAGEQGTWRWRIEAETSTGVAMAAEEALFDVAPQVVA